MKPILLAAAVLLLAPVSGVVHAQVAAGSVPNAFDDPARPQAQTPVQTPAGTATSPVAATPANPASEETLRGVIAAAQAGTLDYSVMTDALAEQVRSQEATVVPLIQGFGAVVAVDFLGSEEGIDAFAVTFAEAATQWMIALNDAGEVSALLFRPAAE
ncbi:MAG: hypothetical protein SWI22_14070 [Pseudomonadota bacterium]|nr:hypothetical protein [Pseudomonadota bacterium]